VFSPAGWKETSTSNKAPFEDEVPFSFPFFQAQIAMHLFFYDLRRTEQKVTGISQLFSLAPLGTVPSSSCPHRVSCVVAFLFPHPTLDAAVRMIFTASFLFSPSTAFMYSFPQFATPPQSILFILLLFGSRLLCMKVANLGSFPPPPPVGSHSP